MLVLDDRVFYYGLVGSSMKTRRLGALSVYLAPEGGIALQGADGRWSGHALAVVPPDRAHRVFAECGEVISLLIEPERLATGEIDRLQRDLGRPDLLAGHLDRLRGAAARLAEAAPGGDIAAAEFDRIVLGRALAHRSIDPRIETVIEELEGDGMESQSLATDLAERIGLSSSRFLHLFKEQTGVAFRSYRMWRRARGFLLHANHSGSLTDVALSLGYPDSSHFSHSIRRFYGLQPRSIRIGSRNLRVESNARALAALDAL